MAKHTLKSCFVNNARFSKYVWPFYNIMHESINGLFPSKFTPLVNSSTAPNSPRYIQPSGLSHFVSMRKLC